MFLIASVCTYQLCCEVNKKFAVDNSGVSMSHMSAKCELNDLWLPIPQVIYTQPTPTLSMNDYMPSVGLIGLTVSMDILT